MVTRTRLRNLAEAALDVSGAGRGGRSAMKEDQIANDV